MRRIFYTLFATISMLCYSSSALACDFDDEDGLDVALVLSGGGAKASTQVGVMQIIDELDVPIHCITGTSMGAVVGAFYASGHSADEIANILKDNNWGETFRGLSPRRDKSFVEKEREENYFSGNIASIGKDGLKLPGGLNSMQGLRTLYRHILSDVPLNIDFNNLNIPFRAVATDLATGDIKVFDKGDVVDAILASMAVPGVFAPREIDGQFYVDGGLVANLPIQAAIDMGADIIIAIDVTDDPSTPEAGMSIAATANQITALFLYRGTQAQISKMRDDDLLIRSNSVGITTAAYTRSAEGIEAGRAVGETFREQLVLIKSKAAPQLAPKLTAAPDFDTETLRIINLSDVDDTLIAKRYAQGSKSAQTDKNQDRRLRDLATFGGFGEVDIGHQNGEAVLKVNKNPLGQNLVQLGLNSTSDFGGNSTYGLLARVTRTPLSSSGGDISLSAEFGTNLGLSAELYQPFGAGGRFFVQPEIFLRWDRQDFNVLDEKLADFWIRSLGARARLGREVGKWGVVALEGEINQTKVDAVLIRTENFEAFTTKIASVGAYFATDTLNRNDWPTSGQRLRFRAKRSFNLDNSSVQTDRYEASWLAALDVANFGVLLNARYGNLSEKNVGVGSNELFQLGGFRQLGGFTDSSIPVSSFSYGSVEAFKRLNQTGQIFEVPIYVGAIAELAVLPLDFFNLDEDVTAYSGSVYLGAETPLGPLFLGAAYGNTEEVQLFFKFGRTF